MLEFQNKLTSSFLVFAPTRKRDARQNPGATKIPLPLRAGDEKGYLDILYGLACFFSHSHWLAGECQSCTLYNCIAVSALRSQAAFLFILTRC